MGYAVQNCSLYPDANTWSQGSSMKIGRVVPACWTFTTESGDNELVVVGGETQTNRDTKSDARKVEIWTRSTNTWRYGDVMFPLNIRRKIEIHFICKFVLQVVNSPPRPGILLWRHIKDHLS